MGSSLRTLLALSLALPFAHAAPATPPPDDGLASTPRSALERFLKTTHAGHYDEACAAFPTGSKAGPQIARELRAVMDEYLTIDLAKIPDTPDGDGHPAAGVEELGRIPGPEGSQPIRLMRESSTDKWVFTPATLARVPGWYAALPDRWLRSRLPDFLQRAGPHDVLWWQWLALIPIALVALGFGVLLGWIVRWLLGLTARLLSRNINARWLRRLTGPLILLATIAVGAELSSLLFFTLPAQRFMRALEDALLLLALFWGALRCVDLGMDVLRGTSFAQGRPERMALLPLFSKASKITLAVIAIVEALQRLGYPVASLIAGLGIGGLAVALAAQKTVADLFGSVVLGIDQPFRPGDVVSVNALTGVVESVGLRSTRIRTASRTLVTIPNGQLADQRIETFAPRDRIRLDFTLGLSRATTRQQLRAIIDDLRASLRTRPDAKADPPTVYLTALTSSTFDLAVGLSVDTTSDDAFARAREEILFEALAVVERHGARLALPPREVFFASGQAAEADAKPADAKPSGSG